MFFARYSNKFGIGEAAVCTRNKHDEACNLVEMDDRMWAKFGIEAKFATYIRKNVKIYILPFPLAAKRIMQR